MNREPDHRDHAPTSTAGGAYPSADDLLRDLGGAAGAHARAMATGYWMAIHDADAACLTATELLGYLQAGKGSAAELTGLGYVQAVIDCTQASPARRSRAEDPDREEAARRGGTRVKAWLEGRPRGVMQPALTAVQLALAEPPALHPPSWSGPVRPPGLLATLRVSSGAAKAIAVAALAVALALLGQQVSSSRAAARAAAFDMAIGRQAEYMTAMLLEQRRYEKDSILNVADPAGIEAYAGQWEKARIAMQQTIETLAAANLADEDRQSLSAIRDDSRTYEQGYRHLLAQMRNGRVRSPQDANRMLDDYKPAAHRVELNGVLLATRALQRLRQ